MPAGEPLQFSTIGPPASSILEASLRLKARAFIHPEPNRKQTATIEAQRQKTASLNVNGP
jgi:hypothetical protein